VNLIDKENSFEKASSPVKIDPFHIVIIPPDAY
jgi:hypothetical protein